MIDITLKLGSSVVGKKLLLFLKNEKVDVNSAVKKLADDFYSSLQHQVKVDIDLITLNVELVKSEYYSYQHSDGSFTDGSKNISKTSYYLMGYKESDHIVANY